MPYEEQRQLQEFLLPRYQKDYDDMPKTTNIGWLKNYFRGHFLPSLKRHFCIIIFFGVCLLILLCSQHNSESGIFFMEGEEGENPNYFPASSTKERFLTFLPHGDLFQQKQELENAVFLATTLGRTLIVPPMILGLDVEFTNSHGLRKKLESLRTNKRDSECFVKTTTEQKEIKYEIDVNCLNEYDSYSLLPWDSLFDLNWIKGHLHVLHRKDFNQTQLEQMLNITNPKRDVHEIMKSSLKGRPIPLNAIRSRHEKLFIFDSLLTKDFSGKDLSQQDRRFWDQLDSSLDVNNPEILDVTRRVIQKLGGKGNYVGVHARFVSTLSSQGFIETSLINLTVSLKNYFNQISQDPCAKDSPVIYLATDLSRNDTNLSSFSSQFPCVVMLSDFEKILLPLLELYNPIDETFLFKFLEPLANSIIASSGMELFSVDDGVYSEYAKKLHQGIRI